jgi:hypothetical protein
VRSLHEWNGIYSRGAATSLHHEGLKGTATWQWRDMQEPQGFSMILYSTVLTCLIVPSSSWRPSFWGRQRPDKQSINSFMMFDHGLLLLLVELNQQLPSCKADPSFLSQMCRELGECRDDCETSRSGNLAIRRGSVETIASMRALTFVESGNEMKRLM